jgi:hypothetical protein
VPTPSFERSFAFDILEDVRLRLYAHVTSLKINPQRRRQIVLVPRQIFGDLVRRRSRGSLDHRIDDLTPE